MLPSRQKNCIIANNNSSPIENSDTFVSSETCILIRVTAEGYKQTFSEFQYGLYSLSVNATVESLALDILVCFLQYK